jgi:hypothetical protein
MIILSNTYYGELTPRIQSSTSHFRLNKSDLGEVVLVMSGDDSGHLVIFGSQLLSFS